VSDWSAAMRMPGWWPQSVPPYPERPAALQNALHDQTDSRDTEAVVAVGALFVAFGVRPA
jgi:hypothetical protein